MRLFSNLKTFFSLIKPFTQTNIKPRQLKIYLSHHTDKDKAVQLLTLLTKRKIMNSQVLNFLNRNHNRFQIFYDITVNLEKLELLNENNFNITRRNGNLNLPNEMLSFIIKEKIDLSEEGFIQLTEKEEDLGKFFEIIKFIHSYHIPLNKNLEQLVTNPSDLNVLNKLLTPLIENFSVKQSYFDILNTLDDEHSAKFRLLEFLGENKLFTPKNIVIAHLANRNALSLLKVIAGRNFLNQESFDLLIPAIVDNLNRYFLRVEAVINKLDETNLLDINTLKSALDRVALKLPIPTPVNVPESRKDSSHQIMLEEMVFTRQTPKDKERFKDRNFYIEGVYSTNEAEYPSVCVKTLKKAKKSEDSELTKKIAQHEVKYHRLLNRKAYYDDRPLPRIYCEWEPGKSLKKIDRENLKSFSVVQRLNWLTTTLEEVNILHANYRLHGNIRPETCLLDLDKNTMKLTDFAASYKNGSIRQYKSKYNSSYFHSKNYVGGSDLHYDYSNLDNSRLARAMTQFCDDMYAIGMVTAYLFPELFDIEDKTKFDRSENFRLSTRAMPYYNDTQTRKIKITTKNQNPILEQALKQQAITNFVAVLTHKDREQRCNAQDALNYCKTLANAISSGHELNLEALENTTIKRQSETFEDAIRGALITQEWWGAKLR